MAHAAHEAYLETQILTATPQKLRLLLLEGAIRFGRQALECWGDQALLTQRCAALGRCNDIITELYATIRDEPTPVLRQVREIYRFLLVRMCDVSQATDQRACAMCWRCWSRSVRRGAKSVSRCPRRRSGLSGPRRRTRK